ncbi:MAG: hypothetical protein L0287_10855, partial [Anaerolineae bacterium]|nr:hypothetical protein [Anaerolineae bacterium]
VGSSIGDSLDEVIQFLSDLFTGGFQLWDNFVEFVKRVGAGTLLLMGFDEGSLLVGGIIRRGSSLSDEALRALDSVGDNLAKAGIKLSDEAADGLALAAKSLGGDELRRFMNALGNTCSVGRIRHGGKLARLSKASVPSVCDPQLVKKVLTSYKRFDDATLTASGKLAEKLGAENWATWMLTFANNPDDLIETKRLFVKFGNLANISPEALNTAMDQGPDAVKALSYWRDAFLNNKMIGEELAERAGKDAIALGKLDELTRLTPSQLANLDQDPGKSLIREISSLSVQNEGSFFVLGRYIDELGLEGGYAKKARELGAKYYYPHESVWNILGKLSPSQQQVVWDAIDAQAIRAGAENGSILKYTLKDALLPSDVDALTKLMELVPSHKLSQAERDALRNTIDNELLGIYGKTDPIELPDRMKELKVLILEKDYKITLSSSDLYVFSPK